MKIKGNLLAVANIEITKNDDFRKRRRDNVLCFWVKVFEVFWITICVADKWRNKIQINFVADPQENLNQKVYNAEDFKLRTKEQNVIAHAFDWKLMIESKKKQGKDLFKYSQTCFDKK